MTIQTVSYQTFSDVDYAVRESYARSRQAFSTPAPEAAPGASIDTVRAIDILLGHLEQISYQISRTEARAEPIAAESGAAESERLEIIAGAEALADSDARFGALVEQYAQVMASVEAAGLLDDPFVPAGPFAGMLFDIAA